MKNNYIHTCSLKVSPNNEPYQKPIYDHAKTCLISLIHCLSGNDFSLKSLNKGVQEIKEYHEKYLDNSFPFIIDSGGYSIIAGDVRAFDISKFINLYRDGIIELRDTYDYVFSLDIPILLKDPSANTAQNIYNLNLKSLTDSKKAIEDYPEIGKKFNMVLQWKILKQYKIWDYLYDHLEMKNVVSSYAIGGLVGLGGIVDLKFVPFIGPTFYWLYRYLEKGDFNHKLFIHILGLYSRQGRFMIFFLQRLFSHYLKEFNTSSVITFDTINYSLSSMYKARIGVDVYKLNTNNLDIFHSYELTDDILKEIYTTQESLNLFHQNWDNVKQDQPLTDTSFLIPLYIYSQLQLDNFFDYFIDKYKIIEIFTQYDTTSDSVVNRWHRIERQLATEFQRFGPTYESLTPSFVKQIKESLKIAYQFHDWYIRDKSKKTLDNYMELFIKKIGFPFDLG